MDRTVIVDKVDGWAVLTSDVDREGYEEWATALHQLSEGPCKYIDILYSSQGGDVEYALAIFDLIEAARKLKPVNIIVNGPCLSSATLILQAATHRRATRHSQFLVHYGEMRSDSESETKNNVATHKMWCELFAKRTKMSVAKSKKLHAGESYMTAQQALEHGLIDEVI